MYSFLHADFDSVKIYSTRLYVHLTKEGKEEDFFVTSAEKEDDEFLPVLELPLLVEQRVCAVEILNLPCLASGHNSNPISEDMAVSGAKALLSTATTILPSKTPLSPKSLTYQKFKMTPVGYRK